MADVVANIAKGRVVELYNRVKSNDPANSAFVVIAIKTAGLETDGTLRDYDDVAAVLAAANDEATNTGYARKVLTDADIVALPAPDDVNDRFDIDLPDLTWSSVQTTGGAWSKLLLAYDADTTGGTDAGLLPLVYYDFAVTPDGTDIVAVVNSAGFYRAS